MARKRDIHPSIWLDEKLAEVPINARYLFFGMISNADDAGRLKGSGRVLKAQVFPMDDDVTTSQVAEWRDKLTAAGCVCFYDVDGQEYVHLPHWHKYQTINKRYESALPACPKHPHMSHQRPTTGGLPEDYRRPTVARPSSDPDPDPDPDPETETENDPKPSRKPLADALPDACASGKDGEFRAARPTSSEKTATVPPRLLEFTLEDVERLKQRTVKDFGLSELKVERQWKDFSRQLADLRDGRQVPLAFWDFLKVRGFRRAA
jgi:hypothetical protein